MKLIEDAGLNLVYTDVICNLHEQIENDTLASLSSLYLLDNTHTCRYAG